MNRKPKAEVSLALRKEAGFGCCFCGQPFIDYHHIVPWAKENHHRVEDMMVVCKHHHAICDDNGFDEAEQRKAKRNPHNVRNGNLKGDLYVTSRELRVRFGGGSVINTENLLVIDEVTIVSARPSEDNRLLISALIEDESGNTVGSLVDNEWHIFVNGVWDFESKTKHATIREGQRQIMLRVDARGSEVEIEGSWFRGGKRLLFGPSRAQIGKHIAFAVSGRSLRSVVDIRTKPRTLFGIGPPPPGMFHFSSSPTQMLLDEWKRTGQVMDTIQGLWLWDELRKRNSLPDGVNSDIDYGLRMKAAFIAVRAAT